jgi:hypothetical protein
VDANTKDPAILLSLDPSWPDSLQGKFRFVIADEAHMIRTAEGHKNTALQWLGAASSQSSQLGLLRACRMSR